MLKSDVFYRIFIVLSMHDVYTHVRCTNYITRYSGDSALNDTICKDADIIVQESAVSRVICAQMCNQWPTCTNVFYNSLTTICTACSGTSDVEEQLGTVCFAKQNQDSLEGKEFKIIAKANNRFWHLNGDVTRLITAVDQPDDEYARFMFEKQEDGSYKIKSVALPIYIYDGYNVPGAQSPFLNGLDVSDDDSMRYLVSMETFGYYRIQTKATGRYVRLDPNLYVSTIYNTKDDNSLFQLKEV